LKHSDLLQINEILNRNNKSFVKIEDIREEIISVLKKDFTLFEIDDLIKSSSSYLEVGNGVFFRAGELLNGVTFFAIPEFYDLEHGRVFFVGGEFSFFFKNGFHNRFVELKFGKKRYDSFLIFEGGEMFYLTGFKQWFSDSNFNEQTDIVKFTIVDYEKSVYKIEKIKNSILDDLVKDDGITDLFDAIFENLETFEDMNIASGLYQEEFASKSIPQLIKDLIYEGSFGFKLFPANLSFFLPLDEQLELVNNLVRISPITDGIKNEDFASFYMGKDLDLKLSEDDISLLDRALVLLFDDDNPEKSIDFLYDLKNRNPGEKVINKFLYQAYYVMGDLEKMVEYAEIYKTFFPDDPDSYRCIAEADFSNGNLEKAERELKKSFKLLHPDDNLNRINIGVIWMHVNYLQGNYEAAYKKGQMVLKHDPDNKEVLMFFQENGLGPDYKTEKNEINKYKIIDNKDGKVIKVDFSNDK